MDYFTELLASYKKLKKRSFKLRYISEAENQESEQQNVQDAMQGETVALDWLKTNYAQFQQATFETPWAGETKPGTTMKVWLAAAALPRHDAETGERVGQQASEIQQNVVKASSGKEFGEVAIGDGQSLELSPQLKASPKNYMNFLKKFIGEDGTEETDSAAAVDAGEAAKGELGFLFKTLGFINAPKLTTLLRKSFEALGVICKKNLSEAFKKLCAKKGAHGNEDSPQRGMIGGSEYRGLESQLSKAIILRMTYEEEEGSVLGWGQRPAGLEQVPATEADPKLIEGALQAHAEVLEALEYESPNCDYINDRIGLGKGGRVILFQQGTAKTKGIAITTTQLQKAMLAGIKAKGCEVEKSEYAGGNSGVAANAQGRFNEITLGAAVDIAAALVSNNKDAFREALEAFLKEANQYLSELSQLASEYPIEVGEEENLGEVAKNILKELDGRSVEVESLAVMEKIEEQLNIFSDKKELITYMKNLLSKNMKMLENIRSDGIIPLGTSQKVGLKVDSAFGFTGDPEDAKKRAIQAADALNLKKREEKEDGSDARVEETTRAKILSNLTGKNRDKAEKKLDAMGITDDKAPIFLVRTGQKFSKSSSTKQGQLSVFQALISSAREMFTKDKPNDTLDDEGKPIVDDEGNPIADSGSKRYYGVLDERSGLSKADRSAMKKWTDKIQKDIDKLAAISEDTQVWDANEKVNTISGERVAQTVREEFLDTWALNKIPEIFKNVLLKFKVNGDEELVDLSDRDSRVTLEETCVRAHMLEKIKADKDEPGCRAFLVNTATQIIMDEGIMSQMVMKPSGESFSYDQTLLAEKLGQAHQDGNLTVEVSGAVTYIKFPINGEKITFRMALERQTDSPSFIGYVSNRDLKKMTAHMKAGEENSSVVYEFLRGQQALLEKLLTPSTEHRNFQV